MMNARSDKILTFTLNFVMARHSLKRTPVTLAHSADQYIIPVTPVQCHQCRGYMWNKINSAFVNICRNQFYFSTWKLAWKNFGIISEDYCSSWISSNMFSVAEI